MDYPFFLRVVRGAAFGVTVRGAAGDAVLGAVVATVGESTASLGSIGVGVIDPSSTWTTATSGVLLRPRSVTTSSWKRCAPAGSPASTTMLGSTVTIGLSTAN